jgi:hypothetical protein
MTPEDIFDLASSHFGILQESPEHAAAVQALKDRRR